MTNIEELKQKEMEELTQDELEVFELETLITEGIDSKVYIEIEYNNKTFGALIRPLTSVEWNNATKKSIRNNQTTAEVELLKLGLYNKDGTQFQSDLIPKIPAGISTKIMKELARISGVEFDSEDNLKLARKVMGF